LCPDHHYTIMQLCRTAPFIPSFDYDDLGMLQNDIRRLPSSLGMAVDSLFDDTGVQSTVAVAVRDHPILSCPGD
jgi:hypothetical protein